MSSVSTFTNGASDLAIRESVNSQLPGRTNGPADAYRHVLLSAELTRIYGRYVAKEILNAHELEGFVREGTNERGEKIGFKDKIHNAYMDVYNNNLGIQIGEKIRENGGDWEDVVKAARDSIDNGEAYWFPKSKWEYNPIIDGTNQRMESDDPRLNWPPKWSDDSYPAGEPISKPYKSTWEKQNQPNVQEGWLDDGYQCLKPWAKDLEANRSGKYHIYDPITLDLNGDGIHALAANGFAGALFDHDNDGIRTATGWVNKEDGLLVRDLNGNGIIDNGSELFGDNTTLADGSKAAHGFVALAELDSNSDGKVDALDKAFNELKVWVDANSDGVSQASELRTLMDLDIQSLDVAYQDVNQNLGNGNSIQQLGNYTKADGSTAQMGDAWFAVDKLYSRFIDKIDMTAEQAQAANDERYVQAA